MPWKRKTTTTWAKMPFGPTGHTYIPDLVVDVREFETADDLGRHHLMQSAPWTPIGRDIATLDLKEAWEVRAPGADEAIALVILLGTHRAAAGVGDLVSTVPETLALGRRDRTLIVTGGGIHPFRGSDRSIAFSHLADLIVEAMTPEQLDTLYILSGSPQVPPAVPRMGRPTPPRDRLDEMVRTGDWRRVPTEEQVDFVQDMIRWTLIPHDVPSYAENVLCVREADGETIALLALFDDTIGILVIRPKPNVPGYYVCEWDTSCGDRRPFAFDWYKGAWGRIDALAA